MSHLLPDTIEKVYYSIGEVAEMLGVSNSCLRFWEKEFGIDVFKFTKRSKMRNKRLFTTEHVETFKLIQSLLNEGYTLTGARRSVISMKSENWKTVGVPMKVL